MRESLRRTAVQIPREWPYWAGGVVIAIVNTLLLLVQGRPWGITSALTDLGSKALQLTGLTPAAWSYYTPAARQQELSQFGLLDTSLWLNLGIIAGVLVSGLLSGELRLRTSRRPWKAALLSLSGGLLMGYGARLAAGCNAGALLGGVPSLSLHGWLFALFTFAGVLAGARLFRRLL